MYKSKYLKYKSKYLELKNKLFQKGGEPLFSDDIIIEEVIETTQSNIKENIRDESQELTPLTPIDITKLNISSLSNNHKLGQGQYGVVYDLSPSYAIKKISIIQDEKNKLADILKEIRMSYFVEYLNRTMPFYSGNLAHFNDDTHYYLILKKFKNINELESNIKESCNMIDIAISLVSQLYVLTKKLYTCGISHGDEKFDNLLFEDSREMSDIFEYKIARTNYKIKNCGFRLRLIDWGEVTNISNMKALWDAWLDGINKGINGKIKDDNELNKNAPTTAYLVSVCRFIGDLELYLNHEEFEEKYDTFINRYPNFTPKEIEEFRLNLLLTDNPEDKTKIFKKIGEKKIDGLYQTFDKLRNTSETSFIKWEDKVDFNLIDFEKLPRFKANKNDSTWSIEYCNPSTIELPREVTWEEFKSNFKHYLKYRSSGKDPNLIGDCKHFERFVSGKSEYFKLQFPISNTKIDKDIYNAELKVFFDDLLQIKSKFHKGGIEYNGSYISIIKSDKYLLIISTEKSEGKSERKIKDIGLSILPFSIPLDPECLCLEENTKIRFNPLGNIVTTNKKPIKDLFEHIKDSIISDNVKIVIFPLGFFHFHLNYNELLNKYFGVIHAKFEITTELGELISEEEVYMKKNVQYKDNLETYLELSKGEVKDNKLEHNYIFALDSNNNVKVYRLNCEPSYNIHENVKLSILGSDNFGINDNFFNTHMFAEVNYYYDKKIGEKEDYVFISKVKPDPNYEKAGSNSLFNKNIPFTCSKEMSDEQYKQEFKAILPTFKDKLTDEDLKDLEESIGVYINNRKSYPKFSPEEVFKVALGLY
jgi:hypothetical protein